jgi:hypothetical protein
MIKRPLTENERMLVSRMAEKLPDNKRTQIMSDLERAKAESLNDDESIIRFDIAGYQHPTSIGRIIIADGMAKDKDGADLEVILFTDSDGRLYELEIVRFEEGGLVAPDWATLAISEK